MHCGEWKPLAVISLTIKRLRGIARRPNHRKEGALKKTYSQELINWIVVYFIHLNSSRNPEILARSPMFLDSSWMKARHVRLPWSSSHLNTT